MNKMYLKLNLGI